MWKESPDKSTMHNAHGTDTSFYNCNNLSVPATYLIESLGAALGSLQSKWSCISGYFTKNLSATLAHFCCTKAGELISSSN